MNLGQQVLVHFKTTAFDASVETFEHATRTELRDCCGRRNLDLFHRGAGQLLDAAQATVFTWSKESKRATFAAGATGTTDAVHVGFRFTGNIEVHDKGDALNVEATGCNVGCDQHVERAGTQTCNHAFTLSLRDVTGNTGCAETSC